MTEVTDRAAEIRSRRVPGVEARAGKFPGPSLIPALNAIQARVGWLPREELEELARDTRRPRYEIEGLISFYPHFRTSPPAKIALPMRRYVSSSSGTLCFCLAGTKMLVNKRSEVRSEANRCPL